MVVWAVLSVVVVGGVLVILTVMSISTWVMDVLAFVVVVPLSGIVSIVVSSVVSGSIVSVAGLGNGGKVSGLGVLYFGCVDGDTIVDHWHMVGVVGMRDSVSGVTVMGGITVGTVRSGSMSGGMSSLGVLDFGGVNRDTIVDHGYVLVAVVQGIPAWSG
jgi:hypothetical protein